jgi:ankyrin repeat protein
MATEVTPSHQYRHFYGIWHEIDNNNIDSLINHPKLFETMNEKQQGLTPLHLACLRKNKAIVQFLLSSGADPNISCYQRTPLYTCTFMGEEDLVELLLKYGANPNIMCKGVAPIHLATSKGRIDILELLFNYGADMSLQSPQFGSALHIAAKKNHKFVARFLVEHNCDLNLFDEEGETPLHVACRNGRTEIVNLLLEYSEKLNPFLKEKYEGNTALHLAAINGHWDIFLALAKRYPKLTVVTNDRENKTSFFYVLPAHRQSLRDSYIARRSRGPGFGRLLIECNAAHNVSSSLKPYTRLFADLILCTKDTQEPYHSIYCHKAILWARCHFFRPLLTDTKTLSTNSNDNNSQLDTIDFSQFSYRSLFPVIYYLYSNKLKCERESLNDVLTVAEHFRIPRLISMIHSEMGKSVNIPESTFASDMEQLINNKLFADIIFLVSPTPSSQQSNTLQSQSYDNRNSIQQPKKDMIYAHKAILISRSEYFKVMFLPTVVRENPDMLKSLTNWFGSLSLDKNTQIPTTIIRDVSYQIFRSVMRYIYTWTIGAELNGNTASELLEVSTRMLLERLHEQCQNFFCHHITTTNVCEILQLAHMFNAILLKEECIDVILRNYVEIQKLPQWKGLNDEIRKEIELCLGNKKKRTSTLS